MDDDIVIEMHPSEFNSSRYIIRASYKNDTVDSGYGFAEQGTLFGLFKIGTSLEDSIKKETCAAIKDLKYNREQRMNNRNDIQRLIKISEDHIKNCRSELYGKTE